MFFDSTSTASWQSLVIEAEAASHIHLNEDLQSYLVFLLMRYLNRVDLLDKPLALDFLESVHEHGQHQQSHLRELGDKCLIVSGFFPGLAKRRLVQVKYFVRLGQGAYSTLSYLTDKSHRLLYRELSRDFVSLMDILMTMRELGLEEGLLSPLEAAELIEQLGSQAALATLQTHIKAATDRDSLKSERANNSWILFKGQ